MADEATEDEIRQRAEKRVRERAHLLQHIAAYCIINGFLVVIWALTTGVHSYPWFIWVMVGWGVGLLFNIVSYFTGRRGSAAHDRMVEKEMERLKKGD